MRGWVLLNSIMKLLQSVRSGAVEEGELSTISKTIFVLKTLHSGTHANTYQTERVDMGIKHSIECISPLDLPFILKLLISLLTEIKEPAAIL